MHDTNERLVQEIRALRADLDLAGQLRALRAEIAALRRELNQPAEIAALTKRVEGATSTVDAGTEALAAAVEANKPE
jgi:phage I-like protein